MAKKKSTSNGGCIIYFFIFGIIMTIIGELLALLVDIIDFIIKIVKSIAIGMKWCLPIAAICILLYSVYRLILYYRLRQPLSYEQVKRLAQKYAEEYINQRYVFEKEKQSIETDFRANLDPDGQWYKVHISMREFPAYVSALLKDKRHEWVVLGLERNGTIYEIWVNKGENNKSVSFKCEIDGAIWKCKAMKGTSIFRLHNHPNADPKHFTTLVASDQDLISAKSCSEIVCKEGLHWFDFVCAQGDFLEFYRAMAIGFEVPGKRTSDIIDKIGISRNMDYKMQKLYRKEIRENNEYRKILMALVVIVWITCAFLIGVKNSTIWTTKGVSETEGSSNTEQNEQVMSWYSPMLEEFEYKYENSGITLLKYEGNEDAIIVPDTYIVEETELPVLKLEDTFENNKNVKTIVLSEGIQEVTSWCFYDCDQLKRVYLPATVKENVDAIKNIPKGEILYFGGSEKQWNKLENGSNIIRSDIPFEQVEINAAVGTCIKNINNKVDKSESDQKSDCADLSEFKFDVHDDLIELYDYMGDSDFVKINAEYLVDGKICKVDKMNGTFSLASVSAVVLPEGLEYIDETVFSGSDIKYLYLPTTLKDVPDKFWQRLQAVDTIFYGGTKESFEKICKVDRWDIDVKHMEYNIDFDTLEYQTD